ncbi:MAG TPA: hypothetical protein VF601_21350 [Beijerinckiaceae bacterium]
MAGIANAFLSSRLGEGELLVGLVVGLCLVAFWLGGRDPDHHGSDLHHRHF